MKIRVTSYNKRIVWCTIKMYPQTWNYENGVLANGITQYTSYASGNKVVSGSQTFFLKDLERNAYSRSVYGLAQMRKKHANIDI